jgi:uncharacterized NAD(P)/FAD-binding protein YdhS
MGSGRRGAGADAGSVAAPTAPGRHVGPRGHASAHPRGRPGPALASALPHCLLRHEPIKARRLALIAARSAGYESAVQPPAADVPGALSVAIVGLGPRGLAVLERLLVRLSARPRHGLVRIWAVDPVEHGPGRVWRTDQPAWLTMNATAGEVTAWSPDNRLLAGTATAAPSFAMWTAGGGGPELQSADYPERRHYGRYLRAMFDQLCARAPAGVQVHPIRGAAIGLDRTDGGQWLTVDHGRRRLRVDKVVLATGHADLAPTEEERALCEHADQHGGLCYIGQGLTTDMPLSKIAPGTTVAVRGLG